MKKTIIVLTVGITILGIIMLLITAHKKEDIKPIIMTDLKEVLNNKTLLEYNDAIKVLMDEEEVSFKVALPVRLDGKNIVTTSPNKFVINYGKRYNLKLEDTLKNSKYYMELDSDIKLLRLANFQNNETKNIDYKIKNNKVSFHGSGEGFYIAELEYTNGDIIKLLFM